MALPQRGSGQHFQQGILWKGVWGGEGEGMKARGEGKQPVPAESGVQRHLRPPDPGTGRRHRPCPAAEPVPPQPGGVGG